MKQQDKIDQYLSNNMSVEEKKAFEADLATDADLAKDLAAHREAIGLVSAMGDQVIKKRIQQAEKIALAKVKSSNNRRNVLFFLLFLAATALTLFYFFTKEKVLPPELIYAANFEAYPLTFGDRGSEDLLSAASIAYGQKDYSKALSFFEKTAADKTDAKVALAQGICYMELTQYEQAIQTLARFVDDPLYGEQVQWYLALCFLQTGDLAKAKIPFQILAQSTNGFQQAAAKKILIQLEKTE